MPIYNKAIVIGAMSTLVSACVSFQPDSGRPYYDAAFYDKNRPPVIFQAREIASEGSGPVQLDKVYLQTQSDYHFAMGESLSLEGKHQKAIEAFKTTLIYDPESSHVHLRLAAEYIRTGMISQSVQAAETAIEKDPKQVNARLLLAGLYSSMKMYDSALEQYETVMKIDPLNQEAPMYLGAVYADKKEYAKAINFFQRLAAIKDYPSPHLAYYYMGRVYIEMKDFNNAEKALVRAIKEKPDFVDAIMTLAAAYKKIDKNEKAIALFATYTKERGANPRITEMLAQYYLENEEYDLAIEQLALLEYMVDDPIVVKMRMALIYMDQKNFGQAIKKLTEILDIEPESDRVRFYLGAIYEEVKDYANAIREFDKVPKESTFYPEAIVHSSYLSKQMGDLNAAIKTVERGIKVRPDVAQLYALYASFLDEKGKHADSYKMLQAATQQFPDNSQLKFFLGTVQDKLGKKTDVIGTMKEVLQLEPNHVQALNYLAYTYAELDMNLAEAEVLARKALSQKANDGYIMDTLGWVLFKQGRAKEAVKVLEAALKVQPTEGIIAEHLAEAYLKVHLPQKARAMYEKAFDLEADQQKAEQIRAKITAIDKQEKDGVSRQPASLGSR